MFSYVSFFTLLKGFVCKFFHTLVFFTLLWKISTSSFVDGAAWRRRRPEGPPLHENSLIIYE